MDMFDLVELKTEPTEENLIDEGVEYIEAKCGLIYITNSDFIYKCIICSVTFSSIEFFQVHILENHEILKDSLKTEIKHLEIDSDQNENKVNEKLENQNNLNQCEESEVEDTKYNVHKLTRTIRKRKFPQTDTDSIESNQNEEVCKKIKNNNVQSAMRNLKLSVNKRSTRKKQLSRVKTERKCDDRQCSEEKKFPKKRNADRIQWQLDKVLSNETEAQEYILSKRVWSFLYRNFTKKGTKRYYRCNRVKFRGRQCASSVFYFANNKTGKCEVYKSNSEHTCDTIGASQRNSRIQEHASNTVISVSQKNPRITTEIKSKIAELFDKGMKLKDIIIKAENDYLIKSGQVKHFIKLLKSKKEKSLKSEVEEWIKTNQNLPQSSCLPFVINYESDENVLRFFVSSRNLLSNAINARMINLNGVKKINWHTYTIFLPGIIEDSGKFKSFGIAVCQNDEVDDFVFIFKSLVDSLQNNFNVKFGPKILFRDSNSNVETALGKVFDDKNIRTKICWNHVRNKLRIKLEYLLPEHHNKKEEILKDLDEIQKCLTFEKFKETIDEFANKWALYVEFVTYFHQEWVDKNFNWFEGVDQEFLSNNNPIDQLIKTIQNDEHFRERLPFGLFKNKFVEWINNLSNSTTYNSSNKDNSDISFKTETLIQVPHISLSPTLKTRSEPISSKPNNPKTTYKKTIGTKTSALKISQNNKKKRSQKLWKEEMTFKSLTEAEAAVESEKIWSLSMKNRPKAGTKIHYRCNKVPFRGTQCDACIYLLLKSDSTAVILFRSGLPHNCHEIAFKSRGICKEIRSQIERLNDLSWKPSRILDYIQAQNYESLPTKTQISNYLAILRERKYGALSLDDDNFNTWLKNYTETPDNDTKMFIVAHECINSQHQFFFSSKKLLQNAIKIKYIHADEIHKLEWIKFPIYFIGATDSQSNFLSLGIAVCYANNQTNFEFIFKSLKDGVFRIFNIIINPNVLITDTNCSIQLAFNNVFKHGKVKICWDLVRKNIKKEMDRLGLPKEINTAIIKDIENIHRSSSEIEFNEKLSIFTSRWSEYKEFIIYFREEWIVSNRNWYKGSDTSSPTANTKLEIFVKSFKTDQLFRKKISIENFNKILNKYIKAWSSDCIR